MDIIQRNFMRLLRCGAFDRREPLEPMSGWKWNRLYQVSEIHGVTPWIADGISKCSDDFFLQISPTLRQQFLQDQTERIEEYGHQRLTNPLLNRKLQRWAEAEGRDNLTFDLLLNIVAIARNILSQGISLRQFISLGTYLRNTHDPIDYEQLKQWISALGMQRMARLEGSLLTELFLFSADEIRFAEARPDSSTCKAVSDIFKQTDQKAADWYFTQGKSIFVGTSDSSAMLWQVKHSIGYLHYYPTEAVTNFMANFAHSLSHIEE